MSGHAPIVWDNDTDNSRQNISCGDKSSQAENRINAVQIGVAISTAVNDDARLCLLCTHHMGNVAIKSNYLSSHH